MKSQSNRQPYISNSPLGPDLRLFDQCLTDLAIISQLISPPLLLPYFSFFSLFPGLSGTENEHRSPALLHLEEFL